MFNQITNYQASFNVEDPEQIVLRSFKSILFNWLKKKETDKLLRHPESYNNYAYRCSWSNLWRSRSSLATNTYKDDDSVAWALKYQEQNSRSHMFWYTDIGLTHREGTLTVNIKIAYAWDTENLSHKREEPKATIPRFVRSFFTEAEAKSWNIYAQNETFKISDKPFPVSQPGEGKVLVDWILNPARQFPLIIFNGRSLVKEACVLSQSLVGKANVIVIDDNPNLAEEIKIHLPHELRVPFNKYRVFFKIHTKNPRPERHRWFDPIDTDYGEQREALIANLLRNHTVVGSARRRAVEKITDVGRLITLSQLRRASTDSSDNSEQMALFEELLSEADKEREELKKEVEYFATEHGVLEEEHNRLKAKLHASASVPRSDIEVSRPLASLPNSIEECVDAIEPFISPKVVIHPDAKKAAAAYSQCLSVNECWRMLLSLHETMHPLKFVEKKLEERTFKERSGFDYAKTEGKQTKNNSRLSDMRKFEFEGQDFEMWPHLKYGNQQNKQLRIHFAFDEKNQRIIVAHIGDHLENASTRSL